MIGRKLRKRYEIRRHLGDGATATVYLALDTRLGREVALKILLPHVQDTARKRFFQEATAAAQLNHPNIMSIHDIDSEGDMHFLVVEYVEGVALSEYIPASPDVLVDLGGQIARALQYAHDRQIIHRDIKPANIQVTPEGQVKIMDLGLALPREAKRVTAHGMVIGTPAYLSPEQAQGLKLDHRTDIYSLGIVLYEMATGQLPFNADDIGALLLQQVKQKPPSPRSIEPSLPMGLENVILKTMEKMPDRRYQSCASLADALEAVIRPASIETGLMPDIPTDEEPTNRRRTIRLVIADDHALLRRTLVNYLEEQRDDIVVIEEAGDGDTALRQTLNLLPDVLLLDLNMPGKHGLEVLTRVRQEASSVKVLVLTGREEDWYIVQALRNGANGYMLKTGDTNDLVDGIVKVSQGQLVLGEGVAEKMVDGMLDRRNDQANAKSLTEAERQILLYVAAGHENNDISQRLRMSMPVLIETLAHAMNKLGAKDRHSAALKAIRDGLISLDDLHEL